MIPLIHEPLLIWHSGIVTVAGQSDGHSGEARMLLDRRLHAACDLGPLARARTAQKELRLQAVFGAAGIDRVALNSAVGCSQAHERAPLLECMRPCDLAAQFLEASVLP